MTHHCSLCLQKGHYSTTCTIFQVNELNNYIQNLFVENIRYNALNYGLLNITLKVNHHIFIQELSLSKLKSLSKNFGMKTTFNRAILAEILIKVYTSLAKRIVEQDETFFQKIYQRNQLLEQQERDKKKIDQIKQVIDNFRLNIPNLHGENLQTYIYDLGNYLQKVAYNVNIHIPIQLKNKFNILLFDKPNKKENLEEKEDICPICYENISHNCYITTNCNHSFCNECINSYFKTCSSQNTPHCSLCRTTITILYLDREKFLNKLEEGLC